MLKKPVFLVGFMGSGKTTWGKRMAHKLKLSFYDTDHLIAEREGLSISEIFDLKGEAYFRELETELLNTLPNLPAIVATGGGLPCFHENMKKLNSMGTTVYLELPPKALFQRLLIEKNKRPLLAHLDDQNLLKFIETRLAERENTYLQAQIVVKVLKADTNSLTEHLLQTENTNT